MKGDAELSQELAALLDRGADDVTVGMWARSHGARLVEALADMDEMVTIPEIELKDMVRYFGRKA